MQDIIYIGVGCGGGLLILVVLVLLVVICCLKAKLVNLERYASDVNIFCMFMIHDGEPPFKVHACSHNKNTCLPFPAGRSIINKKK